ncbi:MAG: hypothetical protein JWM96_774 [Alphaproteobacteria bacterium]|nr:hypothetical protein [Alphaproteobacteria bacterium]
MAHQGGDAVMARVSKIKANKLMTEALLTDDEPNLEIFKTNMRELYDPKQPLKALAMVEIDPIGKKLICYRQLNNNKKARIKRAFLMN